ncbi:MAG: hypothetical protein AVDCRST_MAG20-2642, partial [uncultured Acidimicrobiales bacterium]
APPVRRPAVRPRDLRRRRAGDPHVREPHGGAWPRRRGAHELRAQLRRLGRPLPAGDDHARRGHRAPPAAGGAAGRPVLRSAQRPGQLQRPRAAPAPPAGVAAGPGAAARRPDGVAPGQRRSLRRRSVLHVPLLDHGGGPARGRVAHPDAAPPPRPRRAAVLAGGVRHHPPHRDPHGVPDRGGARPRLPPPGDRGAGGGARHRQRPRPAEDRSGRGADPDRARGPAVPGVRRPGRPGEGGERAVRLLRRLQAAQPLRPGPALRRRADPPPPRPPGRLPDRLRGRAHQARPGGGVPGARAAVVLRELLDGAHRGVGPAQAGPRPGRLRRAPGAGGAQWRRHPLRGLRRARGGHRPAGGRCRAATGHGGGRPALRRVEVRLGRGARPLRGGPRGDGSGGAVRPPDATL